MVGYGSSVSVPQSASKSNGGGTGKSSSKWRLPKSSTGSAAMSAASLGDVSERTMDDGSGVLYDLYFSAPPKLTRSAAIRYHLTTRNVLAFLLGRSLVGLNFCQALRDLQRRLETYMPPKTNCAKLIVRYLVRKQLHNISNNPYTAAGLLAWSEDLDVRWLEGWREAFVHCCGMYMRLADTPEFECISEVSRKLLETAHLELLSRMRTAEKRLLTFKFDDVWLPLTLSGTSANSATNNIGKTDGSGNSGASPHGQQQQQQARAAYDAFRRFLRQYYEKAYKSWRVCVAQENRHDSWLTRRLARELQDDFGALYDFLVDRDAVWGPGGDIAKSTTTVQGVRRYQTIVTAATPGDEKTANDPVAQMVRLIRHLDYRNNYTPLLYPFPLLPESIAVEGADGQDAPRRGLQVFSMNKSARAREKRVTATYAESNNAHHYSISTASSSPSPSSVQKGNAGANPMANPLIEAFRKHEKSEQPRNLDPRAARVGRWIMLYSVLQVLAGISVDTPHLFFNDVPYFLNPRLTNTPPWAMESRKRQPTIGKIVVGVFDEASRLYSYCWLAPKAWGKRDGPVMDDACGNDLFALVTGTTNPANLSTPLPMPAAIHPNRKDSFTQASPTISIRSGSASDDAETGLHVDMTDMKDGGVIDSKSMYDTDDPDVASVRAQTVNIHISDNEDTLSPLSSPLIYDSTSPNRYFQQQQQQHTSRRHPHLPEDIDTIEDDDDEEEDEDFHYFNNISHERQGMPGFRAPLKPTMMRSQSRTLVPGGDGQSQEQNNYQPLPSHLRNNSNGAPHDASTSAAAAAAAAATNSAAAATMAKIQADRSQSLTPHAPAAPLQVPHLAVRSKSDGTMLTQRELRKKVSVGTGLRAKMANAGMGRSDYAPPSEW